MLGRNVTEFSRIRGKKRREGLKQSNIEEARMRKWTWGRKFWTLYPCTKGVEGRGRSQQVDPPRPFTRGNLIFSLTTRIATTRVPSTDWWEPCLPTDSALGHLSYTGIFLLLLCHYMLYYSLLLLCYYMLYYDTPLLYNSMLYYSVLQDTSTIPYSAHSQKLIYYAPPLRREWPRRCR